MAEVATVYDRAVTLHKISKVLGFQIREDECSPEQRKELNKLALDLRKLNLLQLRSNIENSGARMVNANASKMLFVGCLLLVSVGAIFIYVRTGDTASMLVGIVFGFLAFGLYGVFARVERAGIQKKQELVLQTKKLENDVNARITVLASSITGYLADVDKAKRSRPLNIDFEQVFNALKKKGIMLETIECPNCGGKLEISQVPKKEEILQCKHCGKPILAVNVFGKFKEILGV